MPDKITYYAVIGGSRTIDNPYGLVRRLETDWGFGDETCEKTSAGHLHPVIVEWEHGSFDDELVEVSHEQAEKIIEYFRGRWGAGEPGGA